MAFRNITEYKHCLLSLNKIYNRIFDEFPFDIKDCEKLEKDNSNIQKFYIEELPTFALGILQDISYDNIQKQLFINDFLSKYLSDINFRNESLNKVIIFYNHNYIGVYNENETFNIDENISIHYINNHDINDFFSSISEKRILIVKDKDNTKYKTDVEIFKLKYSIDVTLPINGRSLSKNLSNTDEDELNEVIFDTGCNFSYFDCVSNWDIYENKFRENFVDKEESAFFKELNSKIKASCVLQSNSSSGDYLRRLIFFNTDIMISLGPGANNIPSRLFTAPHVTHVIRYYLGCFPYEIKTCHRSDKFLLGMDTIKKCNTLLLGKTYDEVSSNIDLKYYSKGTTYKTFWISENLIMRSINGLLYPLNQKGKIGELFFPNYSNEEIIKDNKIFIIDNKMNFIEIIIKSEGQYKISCDIDYPEETKCLELNDINNIVLKIKNLPFYIQYCGIILRYEKEYSILLNKNCSYLPISGIDNILGINVDDHNIENFICGVGYIVI